MSHLDVLQTFANLIQNSIYKLQYKLHVSLYLKPVTYGLIYILHKMYSMFCHNIICESSPSIYASFASNIYNLAIYVI